MREGRSADGRDHPADRDQVSAVAKRTGSANRRSTFGASVLIYPPLRANLRKAGVPDHSMVAKLINAIGIHVGLRGSES
jgi:hypothetical protein